MEEFVAFLTIVLGCAAVGFAIPQVIKLYKLKDSSGFALVSWVTWLLYQTTAAAYALVIGSWIFFSINIAWTLFYTVMIGMIIQYKR